jgi:hypothetical protein
MNSRDLNRFNLGIILIAASVLFFCLILPILAGAQVQNQSPKPMRLKVRVNEGLVSADIADCPMQTVLQEVADRTGIIFEVRSQENPLVSLRLDRVDMTEAIRRMAASSNTFFFYADDGAQPQRITMVRVFPRTELPQPSIVYLGTGAVTKGDDIDTADQAFQALDSAKKVEVRQKAVEFLVSGKVKGAVPALIKCISDPAPEVRVAVIDGLAALEDRSALPVVLKRLRDPSPEVRQSAATAVALLGDYRNIKDVKPLSADRDANVVAAAEIALRKLSATAKK